MVDQALEVAETPEVVEGRQATCDLQSELPKARYAANVAPTNTPVQEFVAILTMLLVFG